MRCARPKAGQEGPKAPAFRTRGMTGLGTRARAGGPALTPRQLTSSHPRPCALHNWGN